MNCPLCHAEARLDCNGETARCTGCGYVFVETFGVKQQTLADMAADADAAERRRRRAARVTRHVRRVVVKDHLRRAFARG